VAHVTGPRLGENTYVTVSPFSPVDELDFGYIVRHDFPFFPLVQGRNVHGAMIEHDEDMYELFSTKTIEIYLKVRLFFNALLRAADVQIIYQKLPISDDRGMQATIPLIRRHGRNKGAYYTRVELAEYITDHMGSHLRICQSLQPVLLALTPDTTRRFVEILRYLVLLHMNGQLVATTGTI